MPDQVAIQPTGPLQATIRPPGSKSLTNRALVCAALADGTSTLHGALVSEDTDVMIDGLQRLGVEIVVESNTSTITLQGCGGILPANGAELHVGNSGTTVRFLTALTTLGHGPFRLDGVTRMRERPIQDLLDSLNQLGADARSQNDTGCPPVVLQAAGLAGGTARIRGDLSSQFLSGLLMVAPYCARDVNLLVEGPLVSQPYVQMTLGVMSAFGIEIGAERLNRFHISAGRRYHGQNYEIEPDASAASYFWAAAAITQGAVTVQGITAESLQGDIAFCDCLARMGCQIDCLSHGIKVTGKSLHGIEADMNSISDTVQTLAVVALFADGPTTITGVSHIRHKETDRIGDLVRELQKLGAGVDELPNGLRITPGRLHGEVLDTYQDHRMAMSLALVGLRLPNVVINDPDCTVKTYPNFFRDLASIRSQSNE